MSINWTAPATASGSIRFYAMLNAVNYDGTNSGDMPNQGILTVPAANAGVSNQQPASLLVYPNPAVNVLHMKLAKAGEKAIIKVWDMSGRLVLTRETDREAMIDVSSLRNGYYLILATEGEHQYLAPFAKE